MPDPSTGDVIGADIAAVGTVIGPILSFIPPTTAFAPFVTLAFKGLAILEPAAYNAIAKILGGQDLTPEEQAVIDDIAAKLQNPESYYADSTVSAVANATTTGSPNPTASIIPAGV